MFLAGPVLAQDSSGEDAAAAGVVQILKNAKNNLKTVLEKQKDKIGEKGVAVDNAIKDKLVKVQKKLEAKRSERVAAQSKKMLDRFEAAIKRLENLSARIATRLEVISKTDKKDVAKETEALTVVKEGITASRTKLAEARTAFEAVVGSETPQTALDEAKAKLGELKEMIASSHQGLVAVVNSIKGESGAKKPAADSEATEK